MAADADDPVSGAELASLRKLAARIEDSLPEGYRVAAFEALAPRVLERPATAAPVARPAEEGLDFDPYVPLLARRGEVLLKSLVALHVAETQLAVEWMTPSEIADLLVEEAGARSIYRPNVSNALRRESTLVTRRRRGRGWAYSLTDRGRRQIEREVRLAQADR